MERTSIGFIFTILIGLGNVWAAGPSTTNSLTYQGRILKADGSPLEHNNVSFLFEITNPTGSCIIYREQVNGINMTNSGGVFDVPIGSGTKLYPADPLFKMVDSFNNDQTFVCDGGVSYTPMIDAIRVLQVQFHDGTGWKSISPSSEIRSVPFAAYSISAKKLGTNVASDFVLKTSIPTCTAGQVLSSNGTTISCVNDAGATGLVSTVSGSGPITVTGTSSVTVSATVGTTAGTLAAGDDSRFSDSRTPTGSAGGDLSGTYPNPTVANNAITTAKINDAAVTTTKLFANPGINRLVSTDSTTGANLTHLDCSVGELLTWSVANGWQCTSQNSLTVGTTVNFTGSLAGDVSGTQGATSVNKIKGITVDTTGLTTGQILKYDGTKWAPAADSNAGGTITGVTAGTGLTGGGTTGAVTLNVDVGTSANQIPQLDAGGKISASVMPAFTGDATSTGGTTALTLANSGVTAGTYKSVTVDAKGRVTAGTNPSTLAGYGITDALPLAGGTMSGAIDMNSNNLTNLGYVTMSANKSLHLSNNAADPGGLTPADKGKTWYNTTTNQIKYWDGTSAVALGVAGAGLTSLGGQTGSTQTFAIGAAGNTPNWSSGSDTHTLNIPMASSAGTTAGLLSKTDYDSFAAKQTAGNYITALTGDVTAAGPGSAGATIAAGAVTTGKILDGTILGADLNFTGVNSSTSGIAVVDSTGKFFNFACGTVGHVPTWTASGFACQAPTPLLPSLSTGKIWIGDGTNVAVAQTMSGDATISTLGAVTLKNTGTAGTYTKVTTDAQGRVTSGTNLSATDIPNLDWTKITSGTPTTLSGYGISDGVRNVGGTPSVQTGLLASRPVFGTAGRLYIASDNNTLYRDTGSAWVALGDGVGSGTVTSVTSSNADISVATTTTTPVLTLNSGTTGGAPDANKIAKLDVNGLLTPAMIPNVDVSKLTSGTLPIARGGTNSAATLNNNRIMASSGGAIVEAAAITANKALISDTNGIPTASTVTNTELGYVSGVTSAIQTQLNGKASSTGWANYSVIGTNGSGAMTAVSGSTTGTILQHSPTGPVYSTAAYPSSTTANQLLFSSANNVVGGLSSANDAVLLTNGSGAPAWAAKSTDTFTQYALLAGRAGGQVLNGGTAASNSLTLDSTANATKGYVLLNPTGGNVGVGTATPSTKLDVAGAVRVGTDATACAAGIAGAIRYNSGNIEYCNGTAWTAFAASGAGITSLNSLTSNTQTFAIGTSGNSPAFVSATSTHTLNIPMASVASVTAGLISKTDYDNFNNKLGTASTFSGDVSGTSSTMSVDKIKGKSVVPVAYSAGQHLRYDGTNWVNALIALSTDVTGTLPVANGGTGATTLPLGSILIGNGTGAVSSLAGGTTGNVIYATSATSWASGSADTAGLVDKTSAQTITGVKTFQPSVATNKGLIIKGFASQTANLTEWQNSAATVLSYVDSTGKFVMPSLQVTGGTPAAGKVLTSDASGNATWAAATSGTVTSVTSTNADISVATTTTTPVLTLNSGTGANQIVKLNGTSQLPAVDGSLLTALNASNLGSGTVPAARMPALSGDVSMTVGTTNTTSVDKIKAKSVVPVAYAAGQHLRYDGTNWVNALVALSTDVTGTLAVANGGTGATTAAAARTNLGLGTSSTLNTGTSSGSIPVIGVSGITANMMCTSDGTSSIICNTAIPTGDFKSDGSISMTGQFKANNGNAGAPSISFASDPDSGFWTAGGGDTYYSSNGTNSFRFNSTYIEPMGTGGGALFRGVPSATAAALTFAGDYDTGLFNPAANTMAVTTGGVERLRVDSSGNVGIGTTSPASALHVVGDIQFTGTITDVSDRRLKKNIQPIVSGLETVRKISVYSYVMKDDPNERTEYGVMAQDMVQILPQLVKNIDPNTDFMGVNYLGLIPWSIKAIQEVDKQVQQDHASAKKMNRDLASVQDENKKLQDAVKRLEEKNKKLEEKISAILLRLEKQ